MNSTSFDSQSWQENSVLLAARRALESQKLQAEGAARPVSRDEIAQLERQGNSAADWTRIRATDPFSVDSVHGSRFEGPVFIDASALIINSTLSDSHVGAGARIVNCGWLSRYFIAAGATVENVDRLAMTGDDTEFGNSLELFHEDLYSRRVRAVAELPFEWAGWISGPEASRDDAREKLMRLFGAIDDYTRAMRSPMGYVAPGAVVRATPIVENAWIGEGVTIEGAQALRNSTVWGSADEPTLVRDGALLRESLVGPGCIVDSQCNIERSILFEWATVTAQAVLKGSAIGPNVRLSECEVNDCLLGPFTTSLHHGLILAAWWPEGKGNVAYGANVGSNHTGRAPDQEIWPGEGVFFGLGCNIKFPSNFRGAPYTIIAAGVEALPQKVDFPFSLVAPPSERIDGLSPAINEIRPGWSLLQNAYGLERQERNFRQRNRARLTSIDLRIFREDIVQSMISASARLQNVAEAEKGYYTDRELPGLGKNYMLEEARHEAIKAYDLGRRLGAARCILRALDSPHRAEAIRWGATILGSSDPAELAARILLVEREWLDLVIRSKGRDDRRGAAILDDYAQRHLGGERDPLIRAATRDFQALSADAAPWRGALTLALRA